MSHRVEVYYNLHKRCLSYRPSGGRVAHAHTILLNDVSLDVQPAGRERVRLEKKKNVHAFVRGVPAFIRSTEDDDDGDLTVANMERQGYRKITYNPYKHESFVFDHISLPIKRATQVAVIGKDIYLTGYKYA